MPNQLFNLHPYVSSAVIPLTAEMVRGVGQGMISIQPFSSGAATGKRTRQIARSQRAAPESDQSPFGGHRRNAEYRREFEGSEAWALVCRFRPLLLGLSVSRGAHRD